MGRKLKYYCTDNYDYYHNVYLKSEHWKELRGRKLLTTPFCEECQRIHNLDVHHINYKNLYDVLLEDLMTLCRSCHKKKHLLNINKKGEKKRISRLLKPKKLAPHILKFLIKQTAKKFSRKRLFFNWKQRDSLARSKVYKHY